MAPNSHFIFQSELSNFGRGSKVMWSSNPSGHALVFVHGFGGKATATWSSFPSLLPREPNLAGWDLFFFGYDGVNSDVTACASDLTKLLDELGRSPLDVYRQSDALPTSHRQHPSSYTRIVLVGHSLGAVVCRRAMLDGYNRPTPAKWAPITELFLFAPAHNGAKIVELVKATFPPIYALLSAAQLAGLFIVLRDLEGGSMTLTTLQAELKNKFGTGTAPNLRALHTAIARNDRVVTNMVYQPDCAPVEVMGTHTHVSVCKPHPKSFPDPVNLLIARL